MRRIALRHHDRQSVGDVGYRRAGQNARPDLRFHRCQTGQVNVRLYSPGHVADRDRTLGLDLLDEEAGRKRFPVEPTLIFGIARLERGHQRRHREEVIAADEEDEHRLDRIAVEVSEIVHLRNGEFQSALFRIVVPPVLPRGIFPEIGARHSRRGGCLSGGRHGDEKRC